MKVPEDSTNTQGPRVDGYGPPPNNKGEPVAYSNDAVPLSPKGKLSLSRIVINDGLQMRDIIQLARDNLLRANDPPRVFRFGDCLVRITNVDGVPKQQALKVDAVLGRLMMTSNWLYLARNKDLLGGKPPREVAADMLVNPDPRLPVLSGITRVPILTPKGSLLVKSGYDSDSGLMYLPSEDLVLHEVSVQPSAEETKYALAMLREDLLGDFPFQAASDLAHALAALLTPFVRPYINGAVPVVIIVAPTPGSGKGLIADTIYLVFVGSTCPVTTFSKNDEEMRKRITAQLLAGAQIVLLDNVSDVDCGLLAAAITARRWSDRVLGQTLQIEVPNNTMWLMTANNPTLSLELARRALRVRIDCGTERPWEREGFRHPDLRSWIQENRACLVWAVLTLIQNWLAKGCPRGSRSLGSFEAWAATVGGILEAAGVEGFLADRDEFYAGVAPEADDWRAFAVVWRRKGTDPMPARQLLSLAVETDSVPHAVGPGARPVQLARFSSLDFHGGESP